MISKILVVGAYQRKLEELAARPGVELMAVVPPAWIQEGKPLKLERAHTSGYELVTEPIALNGHFHLHWYPFLRRRFRAFRPDLVHIDEEPYNLATYQALRLAQRYGSRAVYFTWQNLDRRYPWPFSAFERYVWRHADACIAGNEEAAGIQRRRGFTGNMAVIQQFGVDPDLFSPGPARRSEQFTIGFVGRLVPQKGLWTLCEAFERLPADCELLLVGSGPLKEQIRQRAEAAGWASRLRLAASPSDQMPGMYRQMDCLVLPSLTTPAWKEQFGRALIEAMACGVPVIGSDSGEIPFVVDDAGLVTPEGSVEALASALAELRDNPARRTQLASKGRQRVLAHYTQASIAQQTYELYARLL